MLLKKKGPCLMKYRFGSFNMNNMGMSAMTGRDFDRIAEIIKRENLDVVALYNKAEKLGVWELLQSAFPYEAFALPFKRRMSEVEIYEMNLSVRASNGLMRAGAKTLGKVAELVALPSGLRSIRNLVTKSEKEILRSFVELCYEKLNFREKLEFWQKAIEQSGNLKNMSAREYRYV